MPHVRSDDASISYSQPLKARADDLLYVMTVHAGTDMTYPEDEIHFEETFQFLAMLTQVGAKVPSWYLRETVERMSSAVRGVRSVCSIVETRTCTLYAANRGLQASNPHGCRNFRHCR